MIEADSNGWSDYTTDSTRKQSMTQNDNALLQDPQSDNATDSPLKDANEHKLTLQ